VRQSERHPRNTRRLIASCGISLGVIFINNMPGRANKFDNGEALNEVVKTKPIDNDYIKERLKTVKNQTGIAIAYIENVA